MVDTAQTKQGLLNRLMSQGYISPNSPATKPLGWTPPAQQGQQIDNAVGPKAGSFLSGAINALPQLTNLGIAGVNAVGNTVGKSPNIKPLPLIEQTEAEQQHPNYNLAGSIAGNAVPALLSGGLSLPTSLTGVGGRIGTGAAIGGALTPLANEAEKEQQTGDTSGATLNPYAADWSNLDKNAALGGLAGTFFGGKTAKQGKVSPQDLLNPKTKAGAPLTPEETGFLKTAQEQAAKPVEAPSPLEQPQYDLPQDIYQNGKFAKDIAPYATGEGSLSPEQTNGLNTALSNRGANALNAQKKSAAQIANLEKQYAKTPDALHEQAANAQRNTENLISQLQGNPSLSGDMNFMKQLNDAQNQTAALQGKVQNLPPQTPEGQALSTALQTAKAQHLENLQNYAKLSDPEFRQNLSNILANHQPNIGEAQETPSILSGYGGANEQGQANLRQGLNDRVVQRNASLDVDPNLPYQRYPWTIANAGVNAAGNDANQRANITQTLGKLYNQAGIEDAWTGTGGKRSPEMQNLQGQRLNETLGNAIQSGKWQQGEIPILDADSAHILQLMQQNKGRIPPELNLSPEDSERFTNLFNALQSQSRLKQGGRGLGKLAKSGAGAATVGALGSVSTPLGLAAGTLAKRGLGESAREGAADILNALRRSNQTADIQGAVKQFYGNNPKAAQMYEDNIAALANKRARPADNVVEFARKGGLGAGGAVNAGSRLNKEAQDTMVNSDNDNNESPKNKNNNNASQNQTGNSPYKKRGWGDVLGDAFKNAGLIAANSMGANDNPAAVSAAHDLEDRFGLPAGLSFSAALNPNSVNGLTNEWGLQGQVATPQQIAGQQQLQSQQNRIQELQSAAQQLGTAEGNNQAGGLGALSNLLGSISGTGKVYQARQAIRGIAQQYPELGINETDSPAAAQQKIKAAISRLQQQSELNQAQQQQLLGTRTRGGGGVAPWQVPL